MLAQARSVWEGLDGRRRLIGLLGALAVAASVFGIARLSNAPTMALLYSGLEPAAAGEVVAALEARGVAFEVRGPAIYVDGAERDALRLALATEGLPAGGPAGYELLDALSGFGTTSQMFDAAYWRAKEGELARTIAASPNVRAARVHIANPASAPFARAATGAASVTVTMARGELDEAQARAIRYLVASAVAGLAPEAVAVIDAAAGVVLAGAEDAPFGAGALAPTDRAAALKANVERLLEAHVGRGRAIVEVYVDAAAESETISERLIDPGSRVAISSDVEESQESAQGTSPGVTVASNLPDGDVGGGGENTSSATETRERQNYEVSETRRERVVPPGAVRRISVAVMVDGLVEPGPDGAPQWRPRAPDELAVLRGLVETAVGFDPERGDVVTIESLQFTAPPEAGALAEAPAGLLAGADVARLAQIAALAAITLVLILFVLRPMAARRPSAALAELVGPRGLEGPRPLGAPEAAAAPALIEPPAAGPSKIDRLREIVAARGEDSAAVLRAWIEAPDPRKEGGA